MSTFDHSNIERSLSRSLESRVTIKQKQKSIYRESNSMTTFYLSDIEANFKITQILKAYISQMSCYTNGKSYMG